MAQRNSAPGEWITVAEAARRLRVVRSTVLAWAEAGRLDVYRQSPRKVWIGSKSVARLEPPKAQA